VTRPADGSMSRTRARPSVDLPEPEPPTIPNTSPRAMLSETPDNISSRGADPKTGFRAKSGTVTRRLSTS
jgi:hypothetical protein